MPLKENFHWTGTH